MTTEFKLHEGHPPSYTALNRLSPVEEWVLSGICAGKTNTQIAAERCISEQTVKNHVSSIFRKLDVTTRTQALLKALQLGYVQTPRHRIDIDLVKASIKFTKFELIRLEQELTRLNDIYAEMNKSPVDHSGSETS